MLPATLAIPKELLPVLDRPLIDFALDEVRAAGIRRLVVVTSPSKPAVRAHVAARNLDLDVRFCQQTEPLGLGHAVLLARSHVLPGAVAVVLPDDLILGGERGCLAEMIAARRASPGLNLVATMTVDATETERFGVLSVTADDGGLLHADGLVEKPPPGTAPSREAVVGRYILSPAIFRALEGLEPGCGGEFQLTDAIAALLPEIGLAGVRFSGQRFDCGSKEGLLAATLARASGQPTFAPLLAETLERLRPAAAAGAPF